MDILDRMKQLRDEGQTYALATVVRVEKPTSARTGAKAIITTDGVLYGWIGGSCTEPTVKKEAIQAIQDGSPRFLRFCPPERMGSGLLDGIREVQLTCMSGGTLDIYIEPFRPPPNLLLIGHQPVVETLAALGKALDYQVTVMGLDLDVGRFAGVDRVIPDLDFERIDMDPNTYVVVASHGNYDELALEAMLPSRAAYVALVASKKRSQSVLDYLRQAGLPQAAAQRLKYPAGLDIGAGSPQEIAVSILAEIVQVYQRAAPPAVEMAAEAVEQPAAALDPVCGMTVEIKSARYRSVYQGQDYYFCSASCLSRFEKEPLKYLEIEAGEGAARMPADHSPGEHSQRVSS